MSTSTVQRSIPMQEGSAQEMVAFQSQSVMEHPTHQPMQLQHAAPNQVQYVVQNPVQPQVPPTQIAQAPVPNRAMYGYFAIAMGIYHGFWTICFLGLTAWGGTFLFCGVIPSLMTVIWIIMHCLCDCFQNGKWIMGLPMAIATGLRCILYLVLPNTLAYILMDFGEEKMIDDVFFIILAYAAFDAGPMILLTIDWFYYYSGSFDGIFGKKTNPLRCCVGQSSVLFVISWSFIAVFQEYADNVIEFTWPWLLHGIISSAALVFCVLIQMEGIVAGNKLSSPFFLTLSKIMAAAMGIAVLAVLIFIIASLVDGDGSIPGFVFILYLYYYTALSLPSVVAMASFKTPMAAHDQQRHIKSQQKMTRVVEVEDSFGNMETEIISINVPPQIENNKSQQIMTQIVEVEDCFGNIETQIVPINVPPQMENNTMTQVIEVEDCFGNIETQIVPINVPAKIENKGSQQKMARVVDSEDCFGY